VECDPVFSGSPLSWRADFAFAPSAPGAAMIADPDDVFGPKVAPAAQAEPAARLRQSEQRPLSEIQAELRRETEQRSRGDFRRRRQA
jgi:hypothetical protein